MLNWSISMDAKRLLAHQLHKERMISHANALSPSVPYTWSHNSLLQPCLDACNCVRKNHSRNPH